MRPLRMRNSGRAAERGAWATEAMGVMAAAEAPTAAARRAERREMDRGDGMGGDFQVGTGKGSRNMGVQGNRINRASPGPNDNCRPGSSGLSSTAATSRPVDLSTSFKAPLGAENSTVGQAV